MSEILVVNKSKHTAAITFSYVDRDFPDLAYVPRAYKVDRWEDDSIPVLIDTAIVYWRKENDSTWYVELLPGNALVISSGLNLDMRSEAQLKSLMEQSKSLSVMMPNDANVICEGTACLPMVHAFSKARAGIIIR